MAVNIVGTIINETDSFDEVVAIYKEEKNFYIKYGETTLVFDLRQLIDAIFDVLLEEVDE